MEQQYLTRLAESYQRGYEMQTRRQGRCHNEDPVSPNVYQYFKGMSIEFETKIKNLSKEPLKDIEPEMTMYLQETVLRYDIKVLLIQQMQLKC